MRRLLAWLIGIVWLSGQALGAETTLNVLFIAVDDLRPELGCYASPTVKSPNIDRLADSGLLFNRAYCQLALCNPSRASLLSGRRPETLRVFDLKTFVRKSDPDLLTLPQLFKNHGYQTLRFGKIFHTTNGNHDDPLSWSETTATTPKKAAAAPKKAAAAPKIAAKPAKKKKPAEPASDPHEDELPYGAPDVADEELSDGKIARDAIAALRANKDRPFFLAVGFHKPHLPFVAPKKYWDLYDPEKLPLAPNPSLPKDAPAFASNDASELRRYKGIPDQGAIANEEARRLIHGYHACISYVDAQIGKMLAELDRLGLRDNTVVILWGDHGYHLGEQGTWNKRTNWEIATRVPLMISIPGQETRGARTDALVEFVDIYPTLAELCGLPAPDKLEGTSFVPLLDNPTRPWKRAAFSIYQKEIPELGLGYGRAMRTDRYRFIEWSAPGRDTRIHELYDHQTDPQETTNIAARPENQELLAQLAQQLQEGWKGALPPAETPSLYSERLRPQFHFTPPRNWINDPNGLVYLDGEYHLFFQYNPFGDKWGHMSWGHAVSPDLVRWTNLDVAIPELTATQTMIFSGSAVVDEANSSGLGTSGKPPLIAYYTAHRHGNQSQAFAYSLDRGRTFKQYEGNPVLDVGKQDFRDPKVFRHEESNSWIMAVALPLERKISFYSSPDLKKWTHLSDFGPAGDREGIWECPDLFRLPVEGERGTSKWVLMASVGKTMQYFIGDFDGKQFTNDSPPDLVLRPDHGPDYFAAITYNNAPKEAGRVSIGWMSNWIYAADLPTSPWRGTMSLPRQLKLRRTPEGVRLVQAPVDPLTKLRGKPLEVTDVQVTSTQTLPPAGQCLEISALLEPGKASRFGLKVAKGTDQETVIGYDVTSGTLYLDRTRSGESAFSKEFARTYSAPCRLVDGKLSLRIFVDACSVEVFANEEAALTALIFPDEKSTGVELFAEGGPVQVKSLQAWPLESVWTKQ